MLKQGAPFQLYLYYAFDKRSAVFKIIWRFSDLLWRSICKLQAKLKHLLANALAAILYFLLTRLSFLFERLGFDVGDIPLTNLRSLSFYIYNVYGFAGPFWYAV